MACNFVKENFVNESAGWRTKLTEDIALAEVLQWSMVLQRAVKFKRIVIIRDKLMEGLAVELKFCSLIV